MCTARLALPTGTDLRWTARLPRVVVAPTGTEALRGAGAADQLAVNGQIFQRSYVRAGAETRTTAAQQVVLIKVQDLQAREPFEVVWHCADEMIVEE
mmetsp:Transcript_22201/g.50855  ORF Transcript_22201/g.50855 Transcript_22201/m.50855 type:complete len:97 (-) Transcript_22201:1036-1326(-)